LILWAVFFLSPALWLNIQGNGVSTHMFAMAMGLIAAACMAWQENRHSLQRPDLYAWFFLSLLLIPIILQLASGELRNPWRAFEMALYVSAAWLIYRMAGARAADMLGSRSWCLMLAFIGNICVLFAVLQQFQLPLFAGSDLFPVWQPSPRAFAGLLVQQNLQGPFLVLICIPLWSRALTEEKSFPWWLASILPCAGIIATSSRGSALILLVAAAMLIWLSKQRIAAAIRIGAVIMLAAAISFYWHMFPELIGQEVTLSERIASVGVQARLFLWDMCLRLYAEHPWLGIGAGNLVAYGTEAAIAAVTADPSYAAVATSMPGYHYATHNLFLQFLLEWGVLGGVFVLLLLTAVGWRMYQLLSAKEVDLRNGRTQATIGLSIMLLHGMFSVSMVLGFFWVLLALYAAALFTRPSEKPIVLPRGNAFRLILLFIPALLMLYNWQFFITREWRMEQAADAPLTSDQFINHVSAAIDNPWASRIAIEWYLGRLVFERDGHKLILSENYAYRLWMMRQNDLSLRYLILIAHLKNDTYAERRRIALFRAAYPLHELSNSLKYHAEHGHIEGEAIDLGS